jgi:hypothetical protein
MGNHSPSQGEIDTGEKSYGFDLHPIKGDLAAALFGKDLERAPALEGLPYVLHIDAGRGLKAGDLVGEGIGWEPLHSRADALADMGFGVPLPFQEDASAPKGTELPIRQGFISLFNGRLDGDGFDRLEDAHDVIPFEPSTETPLA